MNEAYTPSLADIRAAAGRLVSRAHCTPVMTCRTLDNLTGARLFFKCENFQKGGAFKYRGAINAVFSLSDEEARKGVCTHSSGNHAQALALAARERGIQAWIVMPENAPRVKIEGVRGYGGEIVFCKPTLRAREEGVQIVQAKSGAVFIHPYDNLRVIAGQGTAALELLEEIEHLDIVMAPVGGGGLISGTALSTLYRSPDTRVIAAEPKMADDACRSFKSRRFIPSENPRSMADGLLSSTGKITLPLILAHVHDILTAREETMLEAMRLTWERMKIIIEPSSAVPLAAILENRALFAGKRVGIILSGGNVDLGALTW